MNNSHISTGKTGEAIAVQYLKKKRYKIIEKNYRCLGVEIDIIARHKDTLCFVEVKTRQSLKKGLPREAVTPAKQQKIIMGAQTYLKKHDLFDSRVRFDVAEVILDGKNPSVHLIQNAFVES